MDIDDNDAQDQNLLLVGEGSSKVSPVLRSYALPKFDFDDSLQGQLRFDSLVENEVFLGITSQEDNHWIEEYSRGTGAIQFSSSAVESTRKNVWSEATSSESVEMLLKSVGQEERVVEDTIVEELDACDRPGSLTYVMNSNFQENFLGPEVNADGKQSQATLTSQSHETQISGGALESVVVGEKYNSSVGEQAVDKICDDVNQEASKIASESFVNKLQEDPPVSKAEHGDTGPSLNIDASAVESTQENMSEATFSESSEMLLSSAGQREGVVEETITEELDACDRSGSLNSVVDPHFQENFVESNENADCEQSHATIRLQSEETQISGEILESHVICDAEETINNICDDVNQEAIKVATEPFVNELQEVSSISKVECGNTGSSQNLDATVEDLQEVSERCIENASGVSKDLDSNYMIRSEEDNIHILANNSTVVEACTNSMEKNVEYVDPTVPLSMGSCDMQIEEGFVKEPNDNMQEESLTSSPIDGCVEKEAIEDAITKSETPDSPKSNVGSPCSPFRIQSPIEKTENVVENDGQQVTSGTSLVSLGDNQDMGKLTDNNNDGKSKTLTVAVSSAEKAAEDMLNKDGTSVSKAPNVHHTGDSNDEDQSSPAKTPGLVQVGDETLSSELDAQVGDETRSLEPSTTINQDVTFNERRDARLPLDFRDMDMDVGATDNQKSVEPSLSAEGVIAMVQADSNMAVLTNAVAAVESSKMSSPDTPDKVQLPSGTVAIAAVVTEDQPRSPILGVSLLHENSEEKFKKGFSSEGSSQKDAPEVDSTARSALDAVLPVVENDTLFDGAGKAVFGLANHSDPPVENCSASPSEQTAVDSPAGLEGSKTLETSSLPCYSSAEGDDNAEESMTGDGVDPIILAVNMSDGQQASVDVAGSSECNTNHVVLNEDGSVSMDKPQTSSLSDTKSIGPPQSAKDKHEATKGSLNENALLSKVSNDGEGLQSVPSSSATKEEKSFTFDVGANAGQNLSLSKNMVPSISSSGSQSDPFKLHEDSLVSPQSLVPSSAAVEAGVKGNLERKPRRKSAGRETSKKGNHSKETTPVRRSKQVEKSPPLLTPPATGHITPVIELKPNDSIECSNPKPGGLPPISTSKLPDLNNSTSIFQHSFTDNQQVQLRAQILVYGSLLSGMPPEEPHMIAAFGQSDGGRRAWEAAWHACLDRVRCQKSQASNPVTPTQSRSDVGKRDPDQGIKIGSVQSKVLSGISSPIVNPLISISSPLWNIPTPSDGSQSSIMPRSPLLSHRQTISPLHPYQTPPLQNFTGHNPSWLSQGRFPGQWVASSPVAPFSARFSALPITESVKLTTVKESGAPGTPVDPSAGPGVSTGQPSNDSKSRKRKKVSVSASPHTEGQNQISFLAINQRNSGTAPVVSSHSPKSAALPTPVSNSKSSPRIGEQSIEKVVTSEEILSKIEESKLQAGDAAMHAAAAVSHCQDVWSQLERQKNSGLISDDEAKLASSAVSIAAASSVAKVAAAAAKIASNVAEQARLMADEVFLSNKTESHDQSTISHDNATSIISAAREAARRRIEAASAASKHAENLDAIVKAAELAAEAVSQAGKIVAISNPLPLRELVAAGPEGYWKSPQSSNKQVHTDKQSVETTPNEKLDSGDLAKKQMMINDAISGSSTSFGNDKSTAKGHKAPKLSKTLGIIPESVFTSDHTSDVDQNMPQSTSGTWKENIKEGCLVEVRKDNIKKKAAWFAANVLTLKDGKAFVCYTEMQSDEGSEKLKEWVPLEVEGAEAPRIRIAHPMTTMRSEGTRKRGRTAFTDYSWCGGDRVDVWVQDCWCEAAVVETNKIDVTSLTVRFPAQGDTSVVRSWHVRPALIWKDDKWIEWSSLKGSHSSEGDTPHEKRQKFISAVVEGTEKAKLSSSVNLVESGKHQEPMILPLSAQGSTFDVGKSSKNENKPDTRRTMKRSLQKEQSRVVFGVPKPGKKQKFMDVSMHYVADKSNKNNTPNDPVKLTSYLMPQAPVPRGSKTYSKNDAKEKQVAEIKSKVVKSRKPPVPTVKTLAQKEKLKPSKLTSHDAFMRDENLLDHQIPEDAKETSTSKAISQHLNRGKTAPAEWKAIKVDVKEKSTSEIEPRRSNRRIQPTSRLLEGLQSSLSVSKLPIVSHPSQKSYNKVTPKGSSNSS